MSWVTVIWSILIGACAAMALPYFIVGIWHRRPADLFFVGVAAGTMGLAAAELAAMHANSATQYGEALRWIQVPIFLLVVSTVGFVRLYFGTGRLWLGLTTCAVRFGCLIIGLFSGANLTFSEMTGLGHVQFFGETVALGRGFVRPWVHLAELSSLLMVVFVADASISLWRKGQPGDRRRAVIVGGSNVFFVLVAQIVVVLFRQGITSSPYPVSLWFFPIVAAMACELSYDVIRAAKFSRQLQASEASLRESEQRFRIVADAAPVLIWMSAVNKLCTFFNKRWLEFTGRSLEQEMGNGWTEGVHPDDLQRCLNTYVEAFDAREPFVMQYRLRRHDGEYRWISDNGLPRYDAEKNFVGYIGSCVDVTDLITREQALYDSNERMDLATKAAGLIVWTWDIPRDEVWLSEKDRALFGLSPSEKLTAKRIRSVIHRDDRDLVRQLVEKSLKTDQELEGQYRIVLGDGRVRWVTRRGRVEFDKDGNPLCERGVLMDITEVVKNREVLRESEERVVLAAEAAHLGVWELDIATNELWMSDSALGLFQFDSVARLNHAAIQERVHPDDRARRAAAVQKAIETNGEYEIEYRILLPDGTLRWIYGRGRCIQRQGERARLIGVSMDITERKHAEELFQLATEASPSGTVLIDQQGRILLVNAHAERLFGYARDELIGKRVEILIPGRFARTHAGDRTNFFAAPEARAMGAGRELFARRKDGSEFPVEIGLNPIQTPHGLVVLANVIDISARLAAEEETRRSRDQVELLGRVSLLGEMTASLAHELNQPLAAIVNNATAAIQYLEQGRLNPEQLQEILTDVIADGRRAFDIMQNVRSAIKKGSAIRGPINLNDVVYAVTHIVQPDAAAQFCKLETSLAQDLPAIEGDPIQFQQVMINLVHNAVDAMRDTPLNRRIVEVATNRNGDGTICVAVRDYGSGISEATRGRLFEQFFTTKDDGLGMGLAIVRSIIEAHGGSVAAENAEGGGARFHFRLPIKEGPVQ